MKRKIVGEPYGGPNKKDRIIVNGKILLPMNEIQAKIFAFYKGTKGDGAKKLQYRMKEHYYGIGEKLIQKHLNNIDLQRKRRPRFENRAPLQPINSKTVMDRHQIDLVDMKSMIVKEGSKSYRYVLSVLDVFSRFVWLRALTEKHAETVADKLYKIYMDFGFPRVIQCDQGSEFKGVLKNMCKLLKIKLIYSSSNHPQSQGKIERSHATWKDKIRHDLIDSMEGGVCDWKKNLPALQKIYNEGIHRAIGISPYECLFGRKSQNMVSKSEVNDETTEELDADTTQYDRLQQEARRHLDVISCIRSKAKQSSEKASRLMSKRHLLKSPPSVYNVNDKVLVKVMRKDDRLKRGGNRISAPKALEGTVTEVDTERFRYKIQTSDDKGKLVQKWYNVKDVTAKDYSDEKEKQIRARKNAERLLSKKTQSKGSHFISEVKYTSSKLKGKKLRETNTDCHSQEFQKLFDLVCALQKNTYIEGLDVESMRMGSLQDNALRVNLRVAEDNPGGGNCMFYALSHQLETVGILRTPDEIRQEIVRYLREHPTQAGQDGMVSFENFIHGFSSWENYLEAMSNDGEWGDNLILMGASNYYQVGLQIVSSLPNHDPIEISPISGIYTNTLHLGHIAEFHYVSLEPVTDAFTELCPFCGVFVDDNRCECARMYMCHSCGLFHSGFDVCGRQAFTNDREDNITVLPLENEDILRRNVSDETLIQLVENLSDWMAQRVDNVPLRNSRKLLLAQDFKSVTFDFFLKQTGIELSTAAIGDELFFHTDNTLMDIYDEFRKVIQDQISILVSGYVLVFLTPLVRRWILSLTRRLVDAFSYQGTIILLKEDDYEEMVAL